MHPNPQCSLNVFSYFVLHYATYNFLLTPVQYPGPNGPDLNRNLNPSSSASWCVVWQHPFLFSPRRRRQREDPLWPLAETFDVSSRKRILYLRLPAKRAATSKLSGKTVSSSSGAQKASLPASRSIMIAKTLPSHRVIIYKSLLTNSVFSVINCSISYFETNKFASLRKLAPRREFILATAIIRQSDNIELSSDPRNFRRRLVRGRVASARRKRLATGR